MLLRAHVSAVVGVVRLRSLKQQAEFARVAAASIAGNNQQTIYSQSEFHGVNTSAQAFQAFLQEEQQKQIDADNARIISEDKQAGAGSAAAVGGGGGGGG